MSRAATTGRSIGRAAVLGAALLLLVLAVQPSKAPAQEPEGQLVGVPATGGGVALMRWTGGSVDALIPAAPEAVSFWITSQGKFVGFIANAPDFVNEAFRSLYPDGWMPPQPLLVSWRRPPPPPPANVDCSQVPCVAVTFDDGPSRYTTRVLEILAARGVSATFFVEGMEVEQRPQVLAAVAEAGHEIGNHTYNHKDLTTLTLEEMRWQLDHTANLVEQATGSRPSMLRPPGGAYDARVRDAVGVPIILWSVDPKDYQVRDSEIIKQRVSDTVRSGSIILLHETQPATVDALPAILDMLTERGYHLVTVSELFGGSLQSGRVYTNR